MCKLSLIKLAQGVVRGYYHAPGELRRMYPKKRFCAVILEVNGWMGFAEEVHPICMVTTFDLPQLRAQDPLLASLNMTTELVCS